jgi:DNA-binding SARP family transcriptional activator
MLRVSLFGEFNIQCDGAILYEVLPPRLQSLLSFLLLHRGVPQTRSHLAFLFWPDTSEAQSRTNLRNLLYQLRHALPFIDDYLIITGQYLLWRSDPQFFLDVEQFQQATSRMPKATQEDLEEILNLYKGDLLPGCFDEWIFPVREETTRQIYPQYGRSYPKIREQGDYASALRCVQKLLLSDSFVEVAYSASHSPVCLTITGQQHESLSCM